MHAATEAELAPIRRLLAIARSDTGQAARVANFLLAWQNAADCGGIDLTELWSLDPVIRDDMLLALDVIALQPNDPDNDGLGDDFAALVALWRPALGRPAP
jgi:ParB family transcriptional regulator, chromosome partitioning protein